MDLVTRAIIGAGVTANAVTIASLAFAAIGGVLLGVGWFAWAACAMVLASLGDALDGAVARRSRTASLAGALLDASVDRYEEVFFLGGLAVHFRESIGALVLTIGALAGSFMVSYGSAKAEAIGVPVPPGPMRRPERAACLCAGVVLTALATHVGGLTFWASRVPIIVAVALVAAVANISAIRRLRQLARGPSAQSSAAMLDRPAGATEPARLAARPTLSAHRDTPTQLPTG